MSRFRFATVLILFCLAAFSLAQQAGAPWPKFHQSRTNGGRTAPGGSNGNLRWSITQIGSDAVIAADGTVYMAGVNSANSPVLFALNSDGSTKWTCVLPTVVIVAPAIGSDGTIYMAGDANGLNQPTVFMAVSSVGKLKWTCPIDVDFASGVGMAADGTLYVGSYNGKFYAITTAGKVKWMYQTGGTIASTPAVATDGTIYFGSTDHKVYALTSAGVLKWSTQLPRAHPTRRTPQIPRAARGSPAKAYGINGFKGLKVSKFKGSNLPTCQPANLSTSTSTFE